MKRLLLPVLQFVKQLYKQLSTYLLIHVSRVQYIMFVATLIGLVAGLIAVLLKTAVHYVEHLVEDVAQGSYAYLWLPTLGLLLTVWLIQTYFNGHIERGIAMVLRAIARKSSYIPLSHTYAHVLTSSLTVGLGGSAGLEAPIVATGSAVGSNLARISELGYRERTLLIACGAAAGIAAVFNAPIAGVVFAIEVLLTDAVVSYFIPLIIASVVGTLCSKIILQEKIIFNFFIAEEFHYSSVPYYVILGILAGFVSLYYARMFKRVELRLHHWETNRYAKAIVGGLLLMAIYVLFPPLFGEGYHGIRSLAQFSAKPYSDSTHLFDYFSGNVGELLFIGAIILMKPAAVGITIGSGGNGGNFAPSLFTGSHLGFFFAKLLNLTGWTSLAVSNFSLVGMAGILSGVMYCPLTAVFFIAEITNGYELFIPLMIVSAISFFIVKTYEPFSMETKKLALEGQIFTHQKEKNILTSIKLEEILQENYHTIRLDQHLRDLVELIKRSEKNIFAVTDDKGRFVGIIELNDIKQRIFQPELYDRISVRSMMKKPPTVLTLQHDMPTVMDKFDHTQSWYLPVLDGNQHLLGFVSKTKLFQKYRETLASQTDLLYDEEEQA